MIKDIQLLFWQAAVSLQKTSFWLECRVWNHFRKDMKSTSFICKQKSETAFIMYCLKQTRCHIHFAVGQTVTIIISLILHSGVRKCCVMRQMFNVSKKLAASIRDSYRFWYQFLVSWTIARASWRRFFMAFGKSTPGWRRRRACWPLARLWKHDWASIRRRGVWPDIIPDLRFGI